MNVFTIGDIVLRDAQLYRDGNLSSTGDARIALELEPVSENNIAANRYMAALGIICKLQDGPKEGAERTRQNEQVT